MKILGSKEKIFHLMGQSNDIFPKKPAILIYISICDHIIFHQITNYGEGAA